MDYKVSLPYGKGVQELVLPQEHLLYELHGNEAPICTDVAAATKNALENPIGSAPLKEIVTPGDTVAIVISDITRLCGTDKFLPVIIAELNEAGIPDQDITLVVATGTHRPHTEEENIIVVGEDLHKRLKIVQHTCKDAATLVDIGTTSLGNRVLINKVTAEADKLILTGAVSLHPFAGFGGGRKALMPGCAAYDTVMFNHAMTLSPIAGEGCNPRCDSGLIEGNPVHQDMTEACALREPDFLVNTVFSPDGDISEVVAGDWYEAWLKGTEDLMAMSAVEIKEQADVVIASAGGYPKDISLYQALKCHANAALALKPGGIIIFTYDCPDIKEPGIFINFYARTDLDKLEQDIREEFTVPGFVALKNRLITKDLTAYMVTRPENFDFVAQTGHIPCHTLEEAWSKVKAQLEQEGKNNYTVTVIGHGAATLPLLKK